MKNLSDKVTVIKKYGTSKSTHESNVAAVMGKMTEDLATLSNHWCFSTAKASIHRH